MTFSTTPRHILAALLTLLLMAALGSCRSSRHASTSTPGTSSSGTSAPISSTSLDRLPAEAASLINGSRALTAGWNTLQMPVSITLTAPKQLSVSGTMSMVNGRSIDVSFKLLGFEVGSAHIEGDSVVAVVKPAHIYIAESISKTFGGTVVSVADLQAMLLGAVLDPSQLLAKGADVTAVTSPSDGMRHVALVTSDMAFGLGFSFPAESFLMERMYATSAKGYTANIYYSDYQSVPGSSSLMLPGMVRFDASASSGRRAEGSVKLNASRAKLNGSVSAKKLTIPADYRKVALSSLLKGL